MPAGLAPGTAICAGAGRTLRRGTADLIGHVAENEMVYRYYLAAKLLRLKTALEARGSPAAMRLAELIGRTYRVVAR